MTNISPLRVMRIDRPQHAAPAGEDLGDSDGGADEQPDVPAYGDERAAEPRYDQRPQHNNGQNPNQNAGQGGGDNEGRRRRRRPRRHREDGQPQDGPGADQDTETAPA